MSPVADCNLHGYYMKVAEDPSLRSTLRSFYGCLTSALCYLHEQRIRHRDVKPENILVKGQAVYFTDFGISLNWENLSRGTTKADPTKTPAYCAPEVANDQERNSSSDVWSLGCIFLEIITILKGVPLMDLRQHFKAHTDSWAFCRNLPQIKTWIEKLSTQGDELDTHSLQWVESMLQVTKELRPTALELQQHCMETFPDAEGETMPFCAECCQLSTYDDSDVGSNDDEDGIWDAFSSEEGTNPTTTSDIVKTGDFGPSISPLGIEYCERDSMLFPNSLPPQQQGSTDSLRRRPVRADSAWSANHASNEVFLSPNSENTDEAELESMRRAPSRTESVWSTSSLNEALRMPIIKDEAKEAEFEQPPSQMPSQGEPNRSNSTPSDPIAQISPTPDDTSKTEPQQRQSSSRIGRKALMGRMSSEGATTYMRSIKKAIPTVEMGSKLLRTSKELKTSKEQAIPIASPKATPSQELVTTEQQTSTEEAPLERVQTQPAYTSELFRCLPALTVNDWKSAETMMSAMGRSKNLTNCLMKSYPELYNAVETSDMTRFNELMVLLIHNGLNINIGQFTQMDLVRRLPMYQVVSWSKDNRYQPLFKVMIQKGNLVDEGSLPFTHTVFFQAANQGSLWAVADLVAGDVRKHQHWTCWTMHGAIQGGHMEIVKYLETYNIFRAATICYNCRFTMLNGAAFYGQEAIMKYLLEKNSVINTLEHIWQGATPLFDSCRIGQANVANMLLDRGASAAFKTKSDYPQYPNYLSLRVACVAGHAAVVKVLLESPEGKKSLDGFSNEYTPLHDACKQGNVEIAHLLLSYGANPNARSGGLWTPLHYAAQKGSTELVALLLEHGSEAYARTGIRGHITPIRLAERNGHQDVMRLLAKAKVERRIEKKSLATTTTDEGLTTTSSMMMLSTTRSAAS